MSGLLALATLTIAVLPAATTADAPGVPGAVHSLSPLVGRALDLGPAPPGYMVAFNVGLDLRNKAELDAYVLRASDPASPDFQHWLTKDQLAQRYLPTPAQAARVAQWLAGSGFTVGPLPSTRLYVRAMGPAEAVQRAFGVTVHLVSYQGQQRYAILEEPRFPADIAAFATGVVGLDNLATMKAQDTDVYGVLCCAFSPRDLRTFYDDALSQFGDGETIVIAGAYEWLDTDLIVFDKQYGLPDLPAGSAQVCTGAFGLVGISCVFQPAPGSPLGGSEEITMDVEYAHGTASHAVILNYAAASVFLGDFQVMEDRIVGDNPGHIVTESWGICEANAGDAYITDEDNSLAVGAAEGQTWFSASGDGGSDACGDGTADVLVPASNPHVMGVGGTTPTCSSGMSGGTPRCGGYGSEVAWGGSGGGKSSHFAKPSWQTGCGVPADGKRDVPDVALEADPGQYGNWVLEAGSDLFFVYGGTSVSSPQWAGIFAKVDQKHGGLGLGLAGPRLYQLCGTSAFHDITSGNNGAFSAKAGYDQVTGLGSAEAKNLVALY